MKKRKEQTAGSPGSFTHESGLKENTLQSNVTVLRKGSSDYPTRLQPLSGMPDRLFLIGQAPKEDRPSAAIVGARLCSAYGHQTAYDFGRILAENGVQIISGMAAGIDSYAQQGALDAGGYSCAVLGCGADICYPRANRRLYDDLCSRGGILTEFPCGTPPIARNFPSRNRIISGLADIVIVVEARERSGSLITVDFALAQGRTVYAVPGRVGDALSDGCNYLIAQGAGIAYSPEAILHELDLMRNTFSNEENRKRRAKLMKAAFRRAQAEDLLSDASRTIYDLLHAGDGITPDELCASAGLSPASVSAALMELCAYSLAEENPRGCFRKSLPRES